MQSYSRLFEGPAIGSSFYLKPHYICETCLAMHIQTSFRGKIGHVTVSTKLDTCQQNASKELKTHSDTTKTIHLSKPENISACSGNKKI